MQPDQRIENEQTRLACLDGIGEALSVRCCIQAERRSSDHLDRQRLEIDTRRHKATRAGTPLNLTAKEFLLLTHLVRSAGQVVSRSEIASHVWAINFATNTNVVDVMVRRLRAKVDDPFQPKLIHTVRGAGYVLKAG